MKLIINADDLALSETVNRAIFELMAQRCITSATMLANAPAFADAVAGSVEFPHCSFGVHQPYRVPAAHGLSSIWNAALRRYGRTSATGGFTDLSTFYDTARSRALAQDSFELMVHPGDPEREDETALLKERWRERLGFETRLISYDELGR